jgi:hypothetical protein
MTIDNLARLNYDVGQLGSRVLSITEFVLSFVSLFGRRRIDASHRTYMNK